MSRSKNRKIADLISGGTFDDGVIAASEVTGLHTVALTGNYNELENRVTDTDQLTNSSGFITVSEVPVVDATAITEGDTSVTVMDAGTDGKVVVRLDDVQVSEFNSGALVLPKGETSARNSTPVLGEIRYNTSSTFLEVHTANGWASLSPPPSITSVSPASFSGAANTSFTVEGAFFDSESVVTFIGSSGREYSTGTTTFNNSGQLTATNGVALTAADEPYKIKVTTGAGGQTLGSQQIDAGTVPAFTTPSGSLSSVGYGTPINTQIQASDAETSVTNYAITLGSLPSGVSLNSSTGAITGTTAAGPTTTYTFTVEATDTFGDTNTRQFSITVTNEPPVWTTPAVGATINGQWNTPNTLSVVATDPEGSAVTFSPVTLPTDFTFSGSTLSYNTTSVGNQSVVLRASDGFNTTDNNFTVFIPAPHVLLYNNWQTSLTISDYSYNNYTGGAPVDGDQDYSNINDEVSFTDGNVSGYWYFYMPVSTTARITCTGAKGGGANNSTAHSRLGGGQGRVVTADVELDVGYYTIVIGKRGGIYAGAQGGGGGGGTFLFSGRRADSNLVTLVAAGGGGGGNSQDGTLSEMDGQVVTANGQGGGYGGGSNGNGGTTGSGSEEGASGSGVFTAGAGSGTAVGQAIINGDGRGNIGPYASNWGGFGGGASGWGGAGGGGGYSGGGAKSINTGGNRCSAGGGGSYIHPTLATLVSDDTLSTDGSFTIQFNP